MALAKNVVPLVFCRTAIGGNNYNQVVYVPLNKVSTLLLLAFLAFFSTSRLLPLAQSSWANCSSSLKFDGCCFPDASFSPFHRYSMGFRSGLIATYFRMVQCFLLIHFFVLFDLCFGSSSSSLSETGIHVLLQNASLILLCPAQIQGTCLCRIIS